MCTAPARRAVGLKAAAAPVRGTAARWDEFVRSAAGATFFHRAGWQTVLRDVFRHRTHFLFTEEAGRITGVLPLAHVKSMLFGQSLTSLPFAVYGGVSMHPQVQALQRGLDVLIATPGRLLDHLGQGHVNLDSVKVVIFDEVDRMMDMGQAA